MFSFDPETESNRTFMSWMLWLGGLCWPVCHRFYEEMLPRFHHSLFFPDLLIGVCSFLLAAFLNPECDSLESMASFTVLSCLLSFVLLFLVNVHIGAVFFG